jgi:hypothetical protein
MPGPPGPDGQSAPSWRPAAPSACLAFVPSSSAATSARACPARPMMAASRSSPVLLHPRGQVSDLRLQVRYLRLHLADPRIPLSQQLRSRAFAARSPAFTSRTSASSPDTGGVADTRCTTSEPALSDQHDTPSRPQATRRGSAWPQIRRQPSLRTQVDRDLLAQLRPGPLDVGLGLGVVKNPKEKP